MEMRQSSKCNPKGSLCGEWGGSWGGGGRAAQLAELKRLSEWRTAHTAVSISRCQSSGLLLKLLTPLQQERNRGRTCKHSAPLSGGHPWIHYHRCQRPEWSYEHSGAVDWPLQGWLQDQSQFFRKGRRGAGDMQGRRRCGRSKHLHDDHSLLLRTKTFQVIPPI